MCIKPAILAQAILAQAILAQAILAQVIWFKVSLHLTISGAPQALWQQ